MSGGNIFEAGDQLHVAPVQVPIGWQRKAEPSEGVLYISPSGSVLASYDDVKAYVLSDGTCKCGLECPFSLRKVFNFDLGAPVKQRTAEDVKADEDVTKLCTHKRKLLAVTELHRSIGSHRPLNPMGAALPATQDTGTTPHVCPHCPTTPATGTTPHAGPPNHGMLPPGQQHQHQQQRRLYPPRDAAGALQAEPFPGYQRQLRPGFREAGAQSPYRDSYGGMLSQPSFSSKPYGDGLCSPAADALGSPEGFLGHHGSGQGGFPGASSAHGNTGGPSACAMAGRTGTPLSPTAAAESPEVNMPHGMEVPRTAFSRKPQLPSLTMQTRSMTTSEKDPLGILDPIPDKHVGQVSAIPLNLSSYQPSLHSQVPVMNVNAPPPAVVPLPSNLPLPTGKPASMGHMGHVQRSQQAGPAPSMSPSPVASPVHTPGRMEASPHRSRPASTSACTSLDHGNFAVPSGHQPHPGSIKVPPSSPRSTMGSPHLAMAASPSPNAAELLNQLLETQITNLVGAEPHNNAVYSPTSSPFSSQSASPKGHSGLVGVPLNQILNQQKAAPFPASSLLSAAAKAQLVNQNKHVAADNGAGGGNVNEAGGSQSGLLTGTGGMEGQSTLNPMLPPNSTVPLNTSEPQSGRAVLRDKLMAQQREASRKRRQSSNLLSDNMSYRMLRQHGMGTHRRPSPSELLWQVSRMGALPPNTSMAQLLQTMSQPGYHNMTGGGANMSVSQGTPQPHPTQTTLQGPEPPPLQHHQSVDQEMMTQMHASPLGSSGPVRPSASPDGVPLGHARPDGVPLGHARSDGVPLGHARSDGVPLGHAHPDGVPLGHAHPDGVPLGHAHPDSVPLGHARPNSVPLGHAGSDGMPLGHAGSCPSPLSCPGHSPQQQSLLHHDMRRTNMAAMAHGVGDGSCGPVNTGQIPPALSCGPGGGMQSLGNNNNNSSGGAQMYHQPVQQQQQWQGVPHPAQLPALPYQGQQHFPDNPPYPDGNIVDPMTWAYQNYQQGMMANHSQYGDGQLQLHQELSTQVEGLPAVPLGNDGFPDGSNCSQAMDAIYRAVVDAARKGVHVTITTTVTETTQATPLSALGTFAAPVSEPAGPPRTEAPLRSRRAQTALPQNTLDPGAGSLDLVTGPADYFGSPGHGTPRGLWDSESQHSGGFDGQSFGIVAAWGTEEFLECSTEVRSGPCMEGPASLVSSPPGPTEASYDQQKGYPGGASGYGNFNIVPRQDLTGDDRSPGSSTSLDGPLAVGREYGRYNGHYRGTATSPSDTKSLSSEEELRHPDSPASELLPYGSRNLHMGKLMWGPLNGFPRWPARLAGEQQAHGNTALLRREEGMVEPENLKTLTHDLGALERPAKRPRRANKRNSHLEAALHEAMSELDKISGTVHQVPSRERQVRPPKRRKISR